MMIFSRSIYDIPHFLRFTPATISVQSGPPLFERYGCNVNIGSATLNAVIVGLVPG
jgi:hypothetical protein